MTHDMGFNSLGVLMAYQMEIFICVALNAFTSMYLCWVQAQELDINSSLAGLESCK